MAISKCAGSAGMEDNANGQQQSRYRQEVTQVEHHANSQTYESHCRDGVVKQKIPPQICLTPTGRFQWIRHQVPFSIHNAAREPDRHQNDLDCQHDCGEYAGCHARKIGAGATERRLSPGGKGGRKTHAASLPPLGCAPWFASIHCNVHVSFKLQSTQHVEAIERLRR